RRDGRHPDRDALDRGAAREPRGPSRAADRDIAAGGGRARQRGRARTGLRPCRDAGLTRQPVHARGRRRRFRRGDRHGGCDHALRPRRGELHLRPARGDDLAPRRCRGPRARGADRLALRRHREFVPAASGPSAERRMIARLPAGWQTTIADLALILFIVTAAAIDGQPSPAEKASAETAAPPASGEPLAVYRAGDGVPPLGQWLAEQAPDSRQYLTIVARYRAGDAARTAERALAL